MSGYCFNSLLPSYSLSCCKPLLDAKYVNPVKKRQIVTLEQGEIVECSPGFTLHLLPLKQIICCFVSVETFLINTLFKVLITDNVTASH